MIARALALVLVLAAIVDAAPHRKTAPDKFAKAAGDLFARAVVADDKGDAASALELYTAALELTPHENIAFNMAELQERTGALREAIRSYELYLSLAPDAPDRAAVEAKIARLEHLPVSVELLPSATIDIATAYVIVDGTIVTRPGETLPSLPLVPGRHVVDIVTPVTSWSSAVYVDVGGTAVKLKIKTRARIEGNAVISAPELDVRIAGNEPVPNTTRFQLATGHHRVAISDRSYECPPISVDVRKGTDISYVYVGIVELPAQHLKVAPFHCRKLEVKALRLAFKP